MIRSAPCERDGVPALPNATTYAAFLAAVLSMQLLPGPKAMLVMSRGIGQGRRVAFWTVLGTTLAAGAIQLPLLALGVASVLRSSPLAFELLRWIGAAYLAWIGAKLLFSRGRGAAWAGGGGTAASPSALMAVRDGLVANLTNPNSLVFMLAFLPQFVDPSRGSATVQLLLFGATQKATGFATLGATALASGAVGGWLARRPGFVVWQERFAGAVMVVLGLRLLVTGARGGR
jgi:threonine/homoserine/homoserine lactone efflux protein